MYVHRNKRELLIDLSSSFASSEREGGSSRERGEERIERGERERISSTTHPSLTYLRRRHETRRQEKERDKEEKDLSRAREDLPSNLNVMTLIDDQYEVEQCAYTR
jgi:hypothetical protein